MATYDYKCHECKEIFEAQHGMNESPRIYCPQCGSKNTDKTLVTAPTIWTSDTRAYAEDMKAINSIQDPALRLNVAKRKARINRAKRGEDPKMTPEQAKKIDAFAKKAGIKDCGKLRKGI